jgi:hypothetical protein
VPCEDDPPRGHRAHADHPVVPVEERHVDHFAHPEGVDGSRAFEQHRDGPAAAEPSGPFPTRRRNLHADDLTAGTEQ